MQFGSTLGEACLTFVITNIDDIFVLVTFFAEAATSETLTAFKITLGQYIGFTAITTVSLIGYTVANAIPPKPIGFLGLLPVLLGMWRLFGLLLSPRKEAEGQQFSESTHHAGAKSVLKVASITVMNGGDNIGTYTPLFSQAKGSQIAVYVVVYYILLGVWILAAFLIMKETQIVKLAEIYAFYVLPFLYVGLGIFIVVKSHCFPWSIGKVDGHFLGNPGKMIMGVITALLLISIMSIMVWVKMRKLAKRESNIEETLQEDTIAADNDNAGSQRVSRNEDRTTPTDSPRHEHELTELSHNQEKKKSTLDE